MNQPPNGRDALVLAPLDPLFAPDTSALIGRLQSAGFIGERYQGDTYFVGAQFARLLVFMGCAPRLVIEPDEHDHWLRICIPQPSEAPCLYAGRQTKTPGCPACKAPLHGWRKEFGKALSMTCPSCNSVAHAAALHWRKSAVVTRSPIIVSPVFDGEATPGEALLGLIDHSGAMPYGYSYIS